MQAHIVTIPTAEITDWASFHEVFKRMLGFPDFYGRNMNAWIDCMGDDGMREVKSADGEILLLQIENARAFQKRCPEQYDALVDCTAVINFRDVEDGMKPKLGLMPIGG